MYRLFLAILVPSAFAVREEAVSDASVERSNVSMTGNPFWREWVGESPLSEAPKNVDQHLVGVNWRGQLPKGMTSFSFELAQVFEIRFVCDGETKRPLELYTDDGLTKDAFVWGMENNEVQVIYEKKGEYLRAAGNYRWHINGEVRKQGTWDGSPAANQNPFKCKRLELQIWKAEYLGSTIGPLKGYQVLGKAVYSDTKGFPGTSGETTKLAFEFNQSCEPVRCADLLHFGDECHGDAERAIKPKEDRQLCHRGERGLLLLNTEFHKAAITSVREYKITRMTFYLKKRNN